MFNDMFNNEEMRHSSYLKTVLDLVKENDKKKITVRQILSA